MTAAKHQRAMASPAIATIAWARRSRHIWHWSNREPRPIPSRLPHGTPTLAKTFARHWRDWSSSTALSARAPGPGQARGQAAGTGRNLESGRRIAGYRVVRELGRGGMGTVYEAVHVGLDRPVALKVLGVHAAPDSSARRRFMNEARTAAGLHHTHIVPVFDVGQAGALCYYAMQRIEGSGLDRLIRYLRRTRNSTVTGSSDSGVTGPLASSRDPGSASQFNSSFSRLWVRVSANLPWRRTRLIRAGGNGAGMHITRAWPAPRKSRRPARARSNPSTRERGERRCRGRALALTTRLARGQALTRRASHNCGRRPRRAR